MAIYRLLQNTNFETEDIAVMAAVFEDLCVELGLAQREDPLRDMVARKVIECAQMGERDPVQLRKCADRAFSKLVSPT
jgi:hypothetical protein